ATAVHVEEATQAVAARARIAIRHGGDRAAARALLAQAVVGVTSVLRDLVADCDRPAYVVRHRRIEEPARIQRLVIRVRACNRAAVRATDAEADLPALTQRRVEVRALTRRHQHELLDALPVRTRAMSAADRRVRRRCRTDLDDAVAIT